MEKCYDGFDQNTVEAVEEALLCNTFWTGSDLATHLFAKTLVETMGGYNP